MAHKLKIGSRVRIKVNLRGNLPDEMVNNAGKETVITGYCFTLVDTRYLLDIDNESWCWEENDFEPIKRKKQKKYNMKWRIR